MPEHDREVSKMSNIKRVGIRMPMGLYLQLQEIAQNYGTSITNLINFIVSQWIEDNWLRTHTEHTSTNL